jgi:hypothetical protein
LLSGLSGLEVRGQRSKIRRIEEVQAALASS